MSIAELADELKIAKHRIWWLVKNGHVPAFQSRKRAKVYLTPAQVQAIKKHLGLA